MSNKHALRITTALAIVMPLLGTIGNASAAPLPNDPHDVRAAYNSLPCVQGGPTADDAATAARLSPLMTSKMRGYTNAYTVSCARAVVQAVKTRGLNPRAATIALVTTAVESQNHNLDGGDRDSVGLFQQRDSWGSFQQRTNPVWATNEFLNSMEYFYPNGSWNNAPIGDVAADVQRPSAEFRFRYGVEVGDATKIVNALWTIGAGTSEAPSVVVEGSGAMQVFARDTNTGQLITNWQNASGSNWKGWTNLDTRAVGTPSSHLDSAGQMNVFTRRDDGHLIHLWQDGPDGAIDRIKDLGGDFAGDPVVVTKSNNVNIAFIRGTDGRLWHKWQDPDNGYKFGDSALVHDALGTIVGKPSVLIDAEGRLSVFVLRADNHLMTAWQTTPGGPFTLDDLGGAFAGDPVAVRKSDGTQVVFIRGTDGQLWHKWQIEAGKKFVNSELVRDNFGQVLGAPAVQVSNDAIQVFARRSDGHMITAWQYTAGTKFDGVDDIGGNLTTDPVIGRQANGTKAAYARFTDGSIMTTWQDNAGGAFNKNWTYLNS
ncbi:hypothetical protein FKR81_15585 [Lentzea tibetensis]|uniref:PLL-like beta propeller domain-containing protein n=1 Tax=Lentzea tibetensis TaxID=2591470 RepID=A0A563EVB2_9PSEU|nr:hypothetical protein [Lentzea tibetensis]TWP51606.1 hypothetical protein FKR81_15585 [Lentzea tibetensis]